MTSYGNRGMTFEALITFANKMYLNRKVAIIEKQHTHFTPIRDRRGKIVNCKVEEKATVDFMGRFGRIPIAIEAKHTSGDSLRWDAVQEHQNSFLSYFCEEDEGISIVLVSFALKRYFAVPWHCWKAGRDAWKEAQRSGTRKAEIKTLEAYDWSTNGKASLKADDLLAEWEIKQGGTFGLDYLGTVMKLEGKNEINHAEK